MASKTKIFYATDVHGSETCFMKFINAGKFYGADVVMLGGDITGKMLIPIVEQPGGKHACSFLGRDMVLETKDELEEVIKKIRQTGYYPYMSTPDELARMRDNPDLVEEVFGRVMYQGICRWFDIAEERLAGTDIRCFITPGNDDQLTIDRAFEGRERVVNPEGRVVQLDDDHEMISTGYTNITPWNCPRDIPEDDLAAKIDAMASQVKNMANCVFNFHCPPYGSQLDEAPELQNMTPVLGPGGAPKMVPVGSHAVADSIRRHQPLLGLHGHIHESRGVHRIGRTTVVNPGSEYAEGYLRGAIIVLSRGKVVSCQLTSG